MSLLGLAPFGGCLAALIAENAGGLLHHHFTLTGIRRYVSVARSGRLPRPGGYPAKCSVECGLSSALWVRAATTQPACGELIIIPFICRVNKDRRGGKIIICEFTRIYANFYSRSNDERWNE